MRSLTLAFAALFVLSGVRFDPTQTWADSDLVPAWPESERKPEWPDGPVKDFLRGLQRPDNDRHPERTHYARSCCDAGDTVKTKFKVEPGDGKHPDDRWYAWLNEKWVAIPSDKIVPGYAPDGQAYLFVTDFVPEMIDGYPVFKRIVCFVRPKGGL
jgi:hypothetical protein